MRLKRRRNLIDVLIGRNVAGTADLRVLKRITGWITPQYLAGKHLEAILQEDTDWSKVIKVVLRIIVYEVTTTDSNHIYSKKASHNGSNMCCDKLLANFAPSSPVGTN